MKSVSKLLKFKGGRAVSLTSKDALEQAGGVEYFVLMPFANVPMRFAMKD